MYTVMKNGEPLKVFDTMQEARDHIRSLIENGDTESAFAVAVQVLDS